MNGPQREAAAPPPVGAVARATAPFVTHSDSGELIRTDRDARWAVLDGGAFTRSGAGLRTGSFGVTTVLLNSAKKNLSTSIVGAGSLNSGSCYAQMLSDLDGFFSRAFHLPEPVDCPCRHV